MVFPNGGSLAAGPSHLKYAHDILIWRFHQCAPYGHGVSRDNVTDARGLTPNARGAEPSTNRFLNLASVKLPFVNR